MKRSGILLITAAVLALDQSLKWLIRRQLSPGESYPVIQKIFHITYVQNPGVLFGFLTGKSPVFNGILVGVSLGLIIFGLVGIFREGYLRWRWALGLLIAGVAGNLGDRLRWGYVVDFLDFRIWPVFNLADLAVSVAVIIFLSEILLVRKGR